MALNIDTTRPLRSPRQLLALVEAVYAADDADEKPYLEWKSTLPLAKTDKESHAIIGRCIIGLANRSVAAAATHFGGCGYMLIGVEPGNVSGIQMPDPAMFEDWVNRYVGADGPVWTVDTVTFHDQRVLVVTIDPPAAGDHIHTMRTTWKDWDRGTVFVRKLGKTDKADPAGIRMLEDRAVAGTATGPARLDTIEVRMSEPACVRIVDASQDRKEAAVAAAEAALGPIPESSSAIETPYGRIPSFSFIAPSDVEEYRQKRATYLTEYRRAAAAAGMRAAIAGMEDRFCLHVENGSDTALEAVQVRMKLPSAIAAFEHRSDVAVELPAPPEAPTVGLRIGTPPSFLRGLRQGTYDMQIPSMQRGISIAEHHDQVVLQFDVIHPHDTVRSDTFVLVTSLPKLQGTDPAEVEWAAEVTISARNRSGVVSTSVLLQPDGLPVGIDALLAGAR